MSDWHWCAELCRETLAADGASDAEVEEEAAVIKTQLAFVKQMRGDLDGALSDYRNVLKIKYVVTPSCCSSIFRRSSGCGFQ